MDSADRRIREAGRLVKEYESGDSLPALDTAIDILRNVVALMAEDDPLRPSALASLGAALSTRARRLGKEIDLVESVDLAREAVARTRHGHADLGCRLANQADALLARFQLIGERTDLDEAVEVGRHAIRETPPDHPMLARRLTNLAGALVRRALSIFTVWCGRIRCARTAVGIAGW